MIPVTYGSIALTRHSVKHGKGYARHSKNALVAGKERLNTGVTGAEYRRREQDFQLSEDTDSTAEYSLVGRKQKAVLGEDGKYHMVLISAGTLSVKTPKRKQSQERMMDYDRENTDRNFKPLAERSVSCSGRGGDNGGTKDKSVSCTVASSPDIDNVSSMTGQITLSHDGRHMTKMSDTAYAKERLRFQMSMLKRLVQKGKACYMPSERKKNKLRAAALRNAAGG
jgi:hypothetical protein